MGCASSSPLVNGGGPGGLVETAKTTATEVMSTGENAMNGKCTLDTIYVRVACAACVVL